MTYILIKIYHGEKDRQTDREINSGKRERNGGREWERVKNQLNK